MLTYSFEKTGNKSIYVYLYECIKSDIMSGKLGANEKLPSKRSFAQNMNVSVITVENAYSMLVSEGYIYSVPKKGFYVSDIGSIPQKKTEIKKEDRNCRLAKKEYSADFQNNRIPGENFPFSVWSRLMRNVIIRTDSSELISKNAAGGADKLKKAISDHLYSFRGMTAKPMQIIVGAGTEYLYNLLIQFFGQNKIYGIENPGYQKLYRIYSCNNVKCEFIDLDKNGVDINMLEKSNVDIVHISPSHHFPTGTVTSVSRRYELLRWASEKSSRYIIEDDYDCEFRLCGKPMPAMQSIDAVDKVIYINTFSKSLAPAFRISYMVLPESLVDEFYEKLGFYACTVSNFEQYTLAEFISQGYFEKHINRMRKFYKTIRDDIIALLCESDIAGNIEICNQDEGLHFVIKVRGGFSDETFLKNAEDKNLNIACLSQYYYNREINSSAIVVSYSGIEKETLKKSVDILIECIRLSVNGQ